jgi:hypothetical protein
MTEALITLIVGSIVVCSVLLRYKTAGSSQSVKNMQITTFVFAAFAAGLCITNTHKVLEVFLLSTDGVLPKLFVYSTPFFIPFVFSSLRGEWDSYDIPDHTKMGIVIAGVMLVIAIICFTTGDIKIISMIYFVTLSITIGFFHGLLGSIVAGVNIAMIISHFLIQGKLGIDLATTFDLLEKVGVSYPPIKWAIVISSTMLSFHSFVGLRDLQHTLSNIKHILHLN